MTPRAKYMAEIAEVAKWYGVPVWSITSPEKTRKVVKARRASAWVLRFKYGLTHEQIGRIMGGKDHSTIIHAIGCHMIACGLPGRERGYAERKLAFLETRRAA